MTYHQSIFRKAFIGLWLLSCLSQYLFASDSIKVHFIYGSKPKWKFRHTEKIWLGGTLGGHVGIEYAPNQVIDFVPQGQFHVISHNRSRHSRFNLRSTDAFWKTFGTRSTGEVKRVSFTIPISAYQQARLDSLVKTYAAQVPYDYAFIGMRCAAAAYDILSKVGIMEPKSRTKLILGIFYPRLLRKKMFALSKARAWHVEFHEGSPKRVWEKDLVWNK